MRISDWSSDVCSSDLDEHLASSDADHAALRARVRDVYGPRLAQLGIKPRADDSDDDRLLRAALINELADFGQDSALRDALAVGGRKVLGLDTDGTHNPDAEIGRASGRERVCPYVELQGGGGT